MLADSQVPFPRAFSFLPLCTLMVPRLMSVPFHQGPNGFFSAVIKAEGRQESCLGMARCSLVYSFVRRARGGGGGSERSLLAISTSVNI